MSEGTSESVAQIRAEDLVGALSVRRCGGAWAVVVEDVEGDYGGLGTGGVEARWRRSRPSPSLLAPMSGESLN